MLQAQDCPFPLKDVHTSQLTSRALSCMKAPRPLHQIRFLVRFLIPPPPCRRAILLLCGRNNYSTSVLHQNNPFLHPRLRVMANNTLPVRLVEGRCITSLLTTAIGAICLAYSETSSRFDLGIPSGFTAFASINQLNIIIPRRAQNGANPSASSRVDWCGKITCELMSSSQV